MKTLLITFYDKVACQCGPINHARNEGDAKRAFVKAFKDREDSADFELLTIGMYDHDSGVIEPFEVPENIPVALKQEFPDGIQSN